MLRWDRNGSEDLLCHALFKRVPFGKPNERLVRLALRQAVTTFMTVDEDAPKADPKKHPEAH